MDKTAELDFLLARSLLKARVYRTLAETLSIDTNAWRAEELAYAQEVVQAIRAELYERAEIFDPSRG